MAANTKTFGYARVSTEDQNLDMQIQALEKAGCEKIFSEKRSASARRRQLEVATKHLRDGDTLVVWKLDRLARSMDDLKRWVDKFEKWGVNFVSLHEQIDTKTAMGKAFFHMAATFAQLERDMISERTAAGIAAAKANGRTFGRPTKITGEKRLAMEADIRNISIPMRDVATKHGYKSLTTLNRHFPGLRKQCLIDAGVLKP